MSKVSVEFDGEEYTLRVDGGSFRVKEEDMVPIIAALKAAEFLPIRDYPTGAKLPLRVTVEYGVVQKAKF